MRYFINLRRLFILLALICTACGTALPSVKPFKLEVQQGNVVTSKMLLQLRPGMTKSQVRFIMGTPLIQDSFHGKRWDYAYQLREGGKLKEQRRVILDFENELLKTVRGDVMAAGSPEAAAFAAKDAAESATKAVDKNAADVKPANITENPSAKKPAEPTQDKKMVVPPALVPGAQLPDATSPAASTTPENTLAPTAAAEQSMMPVVKASAEPAAIAPLMPDAPHDAIAPAGSTIMPTIPTAAEANLPVAVPAASAAAVSVPSAPEPIAEIAPPVDLPVVPQAPTMPDGYQSSAGMLFDRTLKVRPTEVVDAMAANQETVKSGSVAPPAPKPLPAESDSSFFDRMLEKIGF